MPEASCQILGMPESEGLGRGGLQFHVAYGTCRCKRGIVWVGRSGRMCIYNPMSHMRHADVNGDGVCGGV